MVGRLDKLRAKLTAISLAAMAALVAAGCERAAAARTRPAEANTGAATGIKVDSILPPGEALRRFQADVPVVTDLDAAARSRDDLVGAFVSLLESADTAALANLVISRAEYAFIYFPSSVYSRKPYELAPDIAWMLNEQNSRKGATRLARRLAGRDISYRGYACGSAVREAENSFWRNCQVTYIDPATARPVTRTLFGAVMERGGRYKFLSYANDF